MKSEKLENFARKLVQSGKGILAADESVRTIRRRFRSVGIDSTPESRQAYRQLLLTTPGIESYISGVILFDETIRQITQDEKQFPDLLAEKGIFPGIKVDRGIVDLAGFPGEKITEGLDELRERLAEYRELGAQFTKWRAVIAIGSDIPTDTCIEANANALARFAALSQEAGLVPIVEPEVLMDGGHDIGQCEDVTEKTLLAVFSHLYRHRVILEGMLLKPNMVLPGDECLRQASVEEVAEATVHCLLRVVPAAVPGIVFLSGGQSPRQATQHLNVINAKSKYPWELSFSFGRALQGPALEAWAGQEANVSQAQQLFYHRVECAAAAREGRYSTEMETQIANDGRELK